MQSYFSPPAWNLMLYFFCDFPQQKLCNVIDTQQTGRKMILRYVQQYVPTISIEECMVCLSQTQLVSNPCGHSFCFDCWNYHMKVHHCQRLQYELFPMCQYDGCYHKTNYLLMQKVWQKFPQMKEHFDKLLCLKYSQMSDRVKICNRQGCNKAILINFVSQPVVICLCGNRLCRLCGEQDHFPLSCGDLLAWSKIFSDKQNQWLNQILTQKCPMCKTPIDKNGGCLHMTCLCKYQFCWVCLKVWKGHGDFYSCQSIKKEEHEKRMQEQQQKRKKNQGYYSVRFQEAKCQIQRLQHIIKRLSVLNMKNIIDNLNSCHILTNDLVKLKEMRDFLLEVMYLKYNTQIYIFFQLQGYNLLKTDLLTIKGKVQELDDYLENKIKLAQNANVMAEESKKKTLLYKKM